MGLWWKDELMKKWDCVFDEKMNWWKSCYCVYGWKDELMKKWDCVFDELMNELDELMNETWWIDEKQQKCAFFATFLKATTFQISSI